MKPVPTGDLSPATACRSTALPAASMSVVCSATRWITLGVVNRSGACSGANIRIADGPNFTVPFALV